MSIFTFWKRPTRSRRRAARPPAIPPARARLGVTLETWRKNETLVKDSEALLGGDLARAMLDVLALESPHNLHLSGADIPARALHQARIEGYNLCLNNLESFAVPHPESAGALESTFNKPEE